MAVFQPLRDKLSALPVHAIIPDVLRDVLANIVTVVAAPTGSGKSMMLPSALADAVDEQVVVLVPRRFLATDAACNVAELSDTKLGNEVGFALGQVNGEKSLHVPSTRLLFCTYGYALRSGLINTAKNIVLDEVHEGDEHISLARGVLHTRKTHEPTLRILEMSATVNAPAQASFWKDIATTTIHLAEGGKPTCILLQESPMRAGNQDRTIEQVVISLLQGETGQARNGIAVFRGGIKEVENSVLDLKRHLQIHRIANVEVVGIHGSTPSHERRAARLPPAEGKRKVIVGTNVIESGVNLLWVDAGVSDGVRKVPHHREDTGADVLLTQDLPQSGVTQQMGRVNRNPAITGFEQGIFILHAANSFEQRIKQNGPEIERSSLLAPAFHAASLGYNPTTLKWDVGAAYAPSLPSRLEHAKQDLQRLELVHPDWSLTDEGRAISHLPVSPATGAMLGEARRIDEQRLRSGEPARTLRDTIILAALAETRSLKLDSKSGHYGDQHATSDQIDAMNAYRTIVSQAEHQKIFEPILRKSNEDFLATANEQQLAELQTQRLALEQICAHQNMTLNGFIQVAQLVEEISVRLEKKRGVDLRQPLRADEKYDAARYDELKRCLLNGHVNTVFQFEHGGLRDLLRDTGNRKRANGLPFSGYELAATSMVNPRIPDGTLIVGNLREVMPKRKPMANADSARVSIKKESNASGPLLVVDQATIIPQSVFINWAKDRAERAVTIEMAIITNGHIAPDGKLHSNYAGKARFEMSLSSKAQSEAQHLL